MFSRFLPYLSLQVYSWHWVSGLDTSSSASIAAYVTDLAHSLVLGLVYDWCPHH